MNIYFNEINYKHQLPKNFDSENSDFDIFQSINSEFYTKPNIKTITNARISNNSVLFNYFKIVKESCIGENYKIYGKGYKFFLKFIFPKINFRKERFLLITDKWTSNYYHWHFFALQKLIILKANNLVENSLLFLPKKYKKCKFVLSSLEKIGVTSKQIVFVPRKSNIRVAETSLVTLSSHHPQILKELQKTILDNTKDIDLGFGDKIYLSREGQVLRFVENEKEVVEMLEKYGFKKIIAEKFSYDEQVNIFHKAKYLVSPHGAGLTNILFMPNDSSILEMASKPSTEKPLTDYYKISSCLKLNYYYQECEARGSRKDFHHASLLVDLEELEKNIKKMLQND